MSSCPGIGASSTSETVRRLDCYIYILRAITPRSSPDANGERGDETSAGGLDPWGKSGLKPSPDHQVELGDDLACLDQGRYASFDRGDRDGLRFGEQVPPDCHEACDFSGRRNPLKVLCVDPFSPSSAGRPLADDSERASEATRL